MTWRYLDDSKTAVTNDNGVFVPCDEANRDWRAIDPATVLNPDGSPQQPPPPAPEG